MKILVFGGAGMVGSRFIDLYKSEYSFISPTIEEVDILKKDQLQKVITESEAPVIVNFAAFTNVPQAEEQKDDKEGIVYQINARAVADMADICKEIGVHLVHISTEYVFDGQKSTGPYTEEDTPNPSNWYGQTKYYAEQFIQESGCKYTIVRISMPYTAKFADKKDIVRRFIELLREGKTINAIADSTITPVLVDDIAKSLVTLINAQKEGIYHAAVLNSTNPYDFVKLIATKFDLDESLISSTTFNEYTKSTSSPLLRYSWLDSSKFNTEFPGQLHTIEEDLDILKQQAE